MIENLKGDENLVVDGTPRKLREAKVFDTTIRFYDRKETNVIFINVSRGGLGKDYQKGEEQTIKFWEILKDGLIGMKEVVPTIEYFKTDPNYKFYEINGEQSIEEVHREIIGKVFKENTF